MHPQARKAALAAVFAVVACSVYDPTLLVGGGDRGLGSGGSSARGGSSGKSGGAGSGATTGGTTTAGSGGTAGSSVAGSVSGGRAGRGGADTSGTSGSDNLGGAGADGGEAGMNGDGGSNSAGTGGTSGGADQGGTAGNGGRGDAGAGGTSGGRGGSAGSSGSASGGAGSSGMAGTGGTSGASGAAGSAGSAGSGGAPTATGCARLTVSLDASDHKAHFVITLGSVADFRAATISMRVYVPAALGGVIFSYVQEDVNNRFLGAATAQRTQLKDIVGGWTTVTWNVGAATDSGSPAVNKQTIGRIGIEINAASTPAATDWTDPTVIYVDSITADTPTPLSFTFGATGTVNTGITLETDPADNVLWLNSGTSDTKPTPVSANAPAWLATCPP